VPGQRCAHAQSCNAMLQGVRARSTATAPLSLLPPACLPPPLSLCVPTRTIWLAGPMYPRTCDRGAAAIFSLLYYPLGYFAGAAPSTSPTAANENTAAREAGSTEHLPRLSPQAGWRPALSRARKRILLLSAVGLTPLACESGATRTEQAGTAKS